MTLVAFGTHERCEYKGANLFLCHDCGIVHVEDWLAEFPCRRERLASGIHLTRATAAPPRQEIPRSATREVWRDREDTGRERWNPPR